MTPVEVNLDPEMPMLDRGRCLESDPSPLQLVLLSNLTLEEMKGDISEEGGGYRAGVSGAGGTGRMRKKR